MLPPRTPGPVSVRDRTVEFQAIITRLQQQQGLPAASNSINENGGMLNIESHKF